jgi:hypothetical protein
MSKSEGKIEKATPDDLEYVIKNLRADDIQEIEASHGRAAYHILRESVHSEDSLVGKVDGTPICAFGVEPRSLLAGGGVPWMVSTDDILKNKVAFLKHSRLWVDSMLEKYGYLENYVDDRNTVSKRWLKWLGFEFDKPKPYGVKQELFRRFYRGEL